MGPFFRLCAQYLVNGNTGYSATVLRLSWVDLGTVVAVKQGKEGKGLTEDQKDDKTHKLHTHTHTAAEMNLNNVFQISSYSSSEMIMML